MKDKEARTCSIDGYVARSPKRAGVHILLKHPYLVMGAKVSELPSIADTIFPPETQTIVKR